MEHGDFPEEIERIVYTRSADVNANNSHDGYPVVSMFGFLLFSLQTELLFYLEWKQCVVHCCEQRIREECQEIARLGSNS